MTTKVHLAFCLLITAHAGAIATRAAETVIADFELAGHTYYRLEFTAQAPTGNAETHRWEIRMSRPDGRIPFDGCLAYDWQRLHPGQSRYIHDFLSDPTVAKLQLVTHFDSEKPVVENVSLTPISPPDQLVLNGSFRLGTNNFSGWSRHYKTTLREDDEQNTMVVDQNGYALSDYIPVVAGGGYDFVTGAKTWPGVAVLAYDAHKRLIDRVPRDRRAKPTMRMPSGAAYARLLFNTSHDHIPSHRVNTLPPTGLVPAGDPPDVEEPPPPLPEARDEIVLHPRCDPREERAARELQHWHAAITGRRLPLLARPSGKDNLKIHVGAAWAREFEDDLDYLEDSDGYAVRAANGNLYVFGAHPRGTLYGVYALLERHSDILWPRPNPEFEALFTPDPAMEFRQESFRSRPVFAYRHISRGRYSAEGIAHYYQDWNARNGLNTGYALHRGLNYLVYQRGAQLGFTGSHISWLGEAKEHDETFYPLVDGERSISRWRQPCYTHPELVDTIVKNILAKRATLPDMPMEYLASIIADNWTVCGCDRCMQPIPLADGTLLHPKSPYSNKDPLFFSTRNFIMLNAVAEKLTAEWPEARIVTHAYIFTAEPPRVKPHPALIPQFAAYPTQNSRYPILAEKGSNVGSYTKDIWARRFREWAGLFPKGLGYFGYYYTPGFNALADTAAADYRALEKFGAVQTHTEGYPVDGDDLSSWDYDGIEKWVITRLMWDPKQDPAELRDRYIRGVYREAAPAMRSFYRLINELWHAPDESFFVNCHSQAKDLFETMFVQSGKEEEARHLLVEATQAARHPLSRRMIERTLKQFDALRESLGRRRIPYVDEAPHEWTDPVSPHWEKALRLSDFKKVDDWRSFDRKPAEHQTAVFLMHDGENLYVKAQAFDDDLEALVTPSSDDPTLFPRGDRVELLVQNQKGHQFLLAFGPGSHFYSRPDIGTDRDLRIARDANSWMALARMPLNAFDLDPDAPRANARLARLYRHDGEDREESSLSGASIYNQHDSFWIDLHIETKE